MQSASGGFFHALASTILQENGVIYGVSFNSYFIPHYVRAETISELQPMLSSKYVEAILPEDTIKLFLDDVKAKKRILFSGTPCKAAGLISICDKLHLNTENVYFLDFFTCAGVPSRKLWNKKLEEQMSVSTIKNINFRYKEKSYRNYSISFTFKNDLYKPLIRLSKLSDWGRLFLLLPHCCRRSCRHCVFLTNDRKTDFSVGDMWDSSYIPDKWQDDKGVSMVRTHTAKGWKLLEKIYPFAELIEIPEQAGNWAGLDKKNNYIENLDERKQFWDYFMACGYTETVKKYCPITKKEYLLHAVIKPILIRTGIIKYIDKIIYKT